jgi:hypothetical protein
MKSPGSVPSSTSFPYRQQPFQPTIHPSSFLPSLILCSLSFLFLPSSSFFISSQKSYILPSPSYYYLFNSPPPHRLLTSFFSLPSSLQANIGTSTCRSTDISMCLLSAVGRLLLQRALVEAPDLQLRQVAIVDATGIPELPAFDGFSEFGGL